jgi:limonene-1,2-epoxide hydrolase
MALLKRRRSVTDPMSVVTRFVNACNRHDADAVYACLHPEFDSIQPMYPSRNFRGADQVRRNWQAIFDAEPGFRLTVLRQAAADDTVWLELHGAGQEAEVAGVFVMGIEADRVRWARIYSALVEPLPEGMVDPVVSSPANLRRVPALDDAAGEVAEAQAAVGAEGAAEEELIAPVVDIDGGGRGRRRRSRRRPHGTDEAEGEAQPVADDEPAAADEPGAEDEIPAETGSAEAVEEPAAVDWAPPATESEVEVAPDVAPAAPDDGTTVEPPPEVTAAAELLEEREPDVVAEPVPEPALVAEPAPVAVHAEPALVGGDGAASTVVIGAPEAAPGDPEAGPEAGSEDIVWAALTPEEPDDDAEADPAPTTSIERPGDSGRSGMFRGRKRR